MSGVIYTVDGVDMSEAEFLRRWNRGPEVAVDLPRYRGDPQYREQIHSELVRTIGPDQLGEAIQMLVTEANRKGGRS
jgi:hypothetical protein